MHVVHWGDGVDAERAAALPRFYADVGASGYMDWLSEYDTEGRVGAADGLPGSGQRVGRATFAGATTIAPRRCPKAPCALTNDDVAAELREQIDAGALPPPEADALYAIELPEGVTVTLDGEASCQAFCAYHHTTVVSGRSVAYAVHPYMGPGSGCEGGACGGGAYLDYVGSVHAHELVEAVLDPDIGLVTGALGRPAAWYASGLDCGEIGDLCNEDEATLAVSERTWTVQKQWSNAQQACVASAGDAGAPPSAGVRAVGRMPEDASSPPTPRAAAPFRRVAARSAPQGVASSTPASCALTSRRPAGDVAACACGALLLAVAVSRRRGSPRRAAVRRAAPPTTRAAR